MTSLRFLLNRSTCSVPTTHTSDAALFMDKSTTELTEEGSRFQGQKGGGEEEEREKEKNILDIKKLDCHCMATFFKSQYFHGIVEMFCSLHMWPFKMYNLQLGKQFSVHLFSCSFHPLCDDGGLLLPRLYHRCRIIFRRSPANTQVSAVKTITVWSSHALGSNISYSSHVKWLKWRLH